LSTIKYTPSHEWIKLEDDGTASVGISENAQDLLGDIVFVELPDVGTQISAKQEVAEVESVKAASDIYSPVTGEVIAVNEVLLDAPETINTSPEEDGWIYKLKVSDESELDELMDAESYAEHIE
jgi:glycine cleavage system H protein